MAEWIFEPGIGEDRAILVEHGEIMEARIELPSPVRASAVLPARLTRIQVPGRRGIALLEAGGEALVEPLPEGVTEGAAFMAEVLREAMEERGRPKLPRVRGTSDAPRPGPSLAERVGPHRVSPPGEDLFEAAGWSEILEEAMSGEIAFTGGSLRLSLTPAMTLIDVDGSLDPVPLALAAAVAAAKAIRRHDLTGSIGIDFPTLAARPERQRVAAEIDAQLEGPFERSAMNGFGFLQIVRRRVRLSLPEILQADPVGAAARALLRRAERSRGHGPLLVTAAPAVAARIRSEDGWLGELERRVGARADLQAAAGLSISAGHVHRQA